MLKCKHGVSNSAKYFSSFANTSTSDLRSLEGDFGTSSDCKWKQWDFDDRLSIARKVSAFKQKIPQKLAKSTKRAKVTQFIGNQKSREVFEPLIGKLCDKQVLEPLHLENNAVQKLHGDLLSLAIARSNLPAKIVSLSELPNCCITRFVDALTRDVKASRLKKQIVKWLMEDRGKDKEFSYRFTVQDTRLVLLGFMHLVDAIRGESEDPKLIFRLLVIVFTATSLRDSTSLFSMYHFSETKLKELQKSISVLWYFWWKYFSLPVEHWQISSCPHTVDV